MSCSTSLRCIRRIYLVAYLRPVRQKQTRNKHLLDNAVAGTNKRAFRNHHSGEDETTEGNPGNRNGDTVEVAPPVPAPEDEAAIRN